MHGLNIFASCLSLFSFVIYSPAGLLLESRAVTERADSSDHLVRNKRVIDVSSNRNNSQLQLQDIPYVVQILYNGQHVCGGCILAARVILTAANCVGRVSGYSVVAGTLSSRRGGSTHYVNGILRYPNYVGGSFENNIALLSTLEPILLGQGLNLPIQIFQSENPRLPTGTLVTVSGWGLTLQREHSGIGCFGGRSGWRWNFTDKIQSITVPIISIQECRQRNREAPWISSQFICTYHLETRCSRGDTGNALVFRGHLVGVNSWYRSGGADVFVNVALPLYRLWITEHMNHIPPLAEVQPMPYHRPMAPARRQHQPSQIFPFNH